jgi:hypothetical protein
LLSRHPSVDVQLRPSEAQTDGEGGTGTRDPWTAADQRHPRGLTSELLFARGEFAWRYLLPVRIATLPPLPPPPSTADKLRRCFSCCAASASEPSSAEPPTAVSRLLVFRFGGVHLCWLMLGREKQMPDEAELRCIDICSPPS